MGSHLLFVATYQCLVVWKEGFHGSSTNCPTEQQLAEWQKVAEV